MNIPRFLFVLATSIIFSNALACERSKEDCGPSAKWGVANWLDLTMRDDLGRGTAHWTITMDSKAHDFLIEKDERYDGKKVQGTLAIVSGRMMLTKGLDLKEGYEIDAADGPGLMMQLLFTILDYLAPDGPESVSGKISVNHTEKERPIRVATSSASGVFGVPWDAKGSLEKLPDKSVGFDIHFRSLPGKKNEYGATLKGRWKQGSEQPLPDDMSLEGWKIYGLGPYSRKYKSGTVLDYGAQGSEVKMKTVGALREHIKRMDDK
jgi:hypothetical protein